MTNILIADLETAGPNSLRSDLASVVNFGYKFLGEKQAKVLTVDQYPNWFTTSRGLNDKGLLRAALKIMEKADIVVMHYGSRFDAKFLRGRCAIHGLTPPAPAKVVDTWEVARRAFNFSSNRLGDLCDTLGVDHKKFHKERPEHWPGWWIRALAGDKKAIHEMAKYCAQDVDALADLYLALRPYTTTHPRLVEDRSLCKACGGSVQYRGTAFVGEHRYRRFQCTECGLWDRERKKLADVIDSSD